MAWHGPAGFTFFLQKSDQDQSAMLSSSANSLYEFIFRLSWHSLTLALLIRWSKMKFTLPTTETEWTMKMSREEYGTARLIYNS